jgi:hypothetical protein
VATASRARARRARGRGWGDSNSLRLSPPPEVRGLSAGTDLTLVNGMLGARPVRSNGPPADVEAYRLEGSRLLSPPAP